MCNATDDPHRERQHLDQLLGKRIDGLVVTARRADKRAPIGLSADGLPVIYVFSHADDPDALSLMPDDEGGAVLAVEHLAGLGRKRIAHITGPEHFEAVRLRRRAMSRRLADGRTARRSRTSIAPASGRKRGAARPSTGLFDGGQQATPDAIFCGNDQIARGAADALRERGISVPDDVAIVGFDNWDVMTLAARPPLTSIDMNLRASAARPVTACST